MRRSAGYGHYINAEFQKTVFCGEHQRFLEQMAYFFDQLVQGLFIHTFGRQPEGNSQKADQCANCVLRKRIVAWRKLEFCYLGRNPRSDAGCLQYFLGYKEKENAIV